MYYYFDESIFLKKYLILEPINKLNCDTIKLSGDDK